MICPHCRETNFSWARRCFRCGATIRAIVRSPSAARETNDPTVRDELYERLYCDCLYKDSYTGPSTPTSFHSDVQDEEADGWKQILELVEMAAADGREEFSPFDAMTMESQSQIITLPATIGKLKAVRSLKLNGSYLARLPPEIGEMESLEEFDPYPSMRLHWFPYEISRCPRLTRSRVSTRALYGNHKYRPAFPQLEPPVRSAGELDLERLPASRYGASSVATCSVCRARIGETGLQQAWISLNVGTDVLPLLVNACSAACVGRLPTAPHGYVSGPHSGGPLVEQPPANMGGPP